MATCSRPHVADARSTCDQPLPCPHHPQRRPLSLAIERKVTDEHRVAIENMGRMLARRAGP